MTADEKMSKTERRQYLQRMQKRYRHAKRSEKTALLDEMLIHTGMRRESLKRSMRSNLAGRPRSRQRGPKYKAEFDRELAKIWEATDYVCPERLTPNLVELAEKLASHQELRLTPTLKQQLAQVSVATVRRHLPRIPLAERRRQPRPALNQHQQNIPTRMIPRNTAQPGHFEVDLVYHCGGDLEGEFVFTLQLIDVATGWSGRRAILGRSYLVMEDALISLMARIPFPIRELHPDNGGEFLNAHLLTFLKTRYPEIALSRSRPAHPNDNRLVEQKNHTLVRQYLGQRRFDTVTQTRFLNTTYDQLSDLYNFIQPVMRQIDKQWVPDSDSRSGYFKRIHDQARSPFRRLCETDCLSQAKLQPLAQHYAELNPVPLRRDIYKALDHLFAYPNALPNAVQNIYQTIDNVDLFPEVIAALNALDPVLSPIPAKEVAVL